MMALKFHNRVGTLVTLSNNNCTAQRNHPTQEFNNGVVMSAEPLQDNVPFEVRIDKKVDLEFYFYFILNVFVNDIKVGNCKLCKQIDIEFLT